MDGTEKIEPQTPVKKTQKKKENKNEKELVKNTIEINPEIEEQKKGSVAISFGRLNPITVGHEKMVDKLKSVARSKGAKPLLFMSHSQDKKKNPLSYNDKYNLARKAFGPIVQKSKAKTIIQVMQELQNKYSDVTLVVGSDRVKEFESLLQRYNGKDYEFDNIDVISAGERDPDANDVSGMSASKMRALAAAGKEDEFKKGLPRKLQGDAAEIYDMVRTGMQLAEELEAEGLLIEAPLTIAQRRKRGRIMKRYARKIAAARRRKSKRKATQDVIQKRSRRKAINIVRKKVAGKKGKSYSELTPAEKSAIDRKVQKRQRQIERLAKRLMPKVRKTERERLAGRRVNEEFEAFFEDKGYMMVNKGQVNPDSEGKMVTDKGDIDVPTPKEYKDKGYQKAIDKGADTRADRQEKNKKVIHNEERKKETPQDPDVKDMPGSQPKGYYKGVDKDKKDDRARHFKKYGKMDDDNPKAYKPAPGDKEAKTKESKHTKKFKKMYGEEIEEACMRDTKPRKRFHELFKKNGAVKHDKRFKFNRKKIEEQTAEIDRLKDQHKSEKNRLRSDHERELDRAKIRAVRNKTSRQNKMKEEIELENDADLLNLIDKIHESIELDESKTKTALQKKAEKTGISYGILKKVYDRGVAAWRTGHRPGTTPAQWGMARVNSFATKGKGTWGKADKDLAAKVRKEEVEISEKLKVSDGAGEWIKDFQKSDAPQFKGKSKEKRKDMALAAYLDAKNEEVELDSFFDINEQFELIEASIIDKALAAIHKHVMGGTELGDIAYQVSRAKGVDKTGRELERAYIAKYGEPKKKSVGSGAVLRKKYGFKEHLEEGVNDPAIFKAVFLAGGPGSGKSFIVGKTALTALGFKLINSDNAFERALAKANLEATPENIYSPKGQELRKGAKALTGKQLELALEGRLGLVIDGTGKDYSKIEKQANRLRDLGYEVAMIFVNTDQDTALKRNQMRSRSLPDDEVKSMWNEVQKNLGKFQRFFRNKMFIVDNSEGSDFESDVMSVYKKLMTWSKSKPKSSVAREWIKAQSVKEEKGPCWSAYKQVGTKKKNGKEVPNCVPEEHGAGEWGTDKLANRYRKDTPGQKKKIDEAFESLFEEKSCDLIGMDQIKAFEKFVDRMFEKFGIDFKFTKHFGERMSDSRNDPCIKLKELADFVKKIYAKQGKSLKGVAGAEAVIKDLQTDLNIPVAVEYDSKNDEFDVVMKTIMRKKNFRTPNKVIKY